MIGSVAKCSQNKVGIVSHVDVEKDEFGQRVLYRGVTFDGKAWQSKAPRILANNVNEYIVRYILPECEENHDLNESSILAFIQKTEK